MIERLTHIRILTWAAILETIRRKDLYVVAFLAVAGIAAGSFLARAGVRGIETFLRDFALMVVNLLSTAICIWLAARQMPEELSRRTLFPLLARPVRRFDVLLAKFLAVWTLSSLSLAVLAGIGWASLSMFHAGIGPIFWQYLFLRMLSFGPIAALTMSMSLVMTGPATVVLAGLLTACWQLFARTMAESIQTAGSGQVPLKAVYFLLPHLDLFDLSAKAAFNYPPVAPWVLGVLVLYAAAYVFVFLGLGELRFRSMAV